jgi:hypothetical protein
MRGESTLTLDEFTEGLERAVSGDMPSGENDEPKPTQTNAVVLRKICGDSGVAPFYPANMDGVYVRYPQKGHHEIESVRSRRFRAWLSKKFLTAQSAEPKAADLDSAILLLEADAAESPRRELFTRIARSEGKIYVDLCDEDYQSLEIDEAGWRIAADPPVWFSRHLSMEALPYPREGGSLESLREFANLSDDDFILFACWLVSSANPDGPFFVLSISSEHGSGKSALSTVAKSVLDPNASMRLSPPKDEDAVFATASSQWVTLYDNLKKINQEFSDILCRLSTGGTISKRALHTDNDVFSFSAKRPVILNGIAPSLGGLDLLSRTLQIRTLPIPEEKRLTEKEFYARFDAARPGILGALLTAVSSALRMKGHAPKNLPRMADAAAFVMQAEKGGGLPWPEGTFERVFMSKEWSKDDEALENDPIAIKILELSQNGWKGTMKELLAEVNRDLSPEERKFIPQTPRGLSPKLVELAPFLRKRGVICEKSATRYLGHYLLAISKVGTKGPETVSTDGAFSFLDE